MSAKEAVYAALPADEAVARAYREGSLEGLVGGVLRRCPGLEPVESYTVLLHYLLSVLGVPSQRKVEMDGVGIDIAVPDLAALRRRPASALLVCITCPEGAAGAAREAARIQPNRRNVWMACPAKVPGHRTFSRPAVGALPGAAAAFLEGAGSGRLRILGSRS